MRARIIAGVFGTWGLAVLSWVSPLGPARAGVGPGRVSAWGNNTSGQTNVPSSLTNAVAIAAGVSHSLALTEDGRVVAWGDFGSASTNVPASATDIVALAAGSYHSLAVRSNGSVVAWGRNDKGQTDVPYGVSPVVAVAGGESHSLALKTDGRVVAWGANEQGQTSVPPMLTNAVAVAAGISHSLALTADGRVVAWGDNWAGKTNVPSWLTNATAIAAGGSHSLAVMSDGRVAAWGFNGYGETNVPASLSNSIAVAGGGNFSLALRSSGRVGAWGWNSIGQTNVPSWLSNCVAIAANGGHGLALWIPGPRINPLLPPVSQAMPGSTALFTVSVVSSHPFSCQWSFDATPILGATNTELAIADFSPAQAGIYSVVVSNTYGTHTSSTLLQIADAALPVFSPSPPSTTTASPGADKLLSVSVSCALAFGCQWFFSGVAIPDATTTNLTLTNFSLAQTGIYSVVVSNAYGTNWATIAVRLANSPTLSVDGVALYGGSTTRVDKARISMANTGTGSAIYYTLDRSDPDFTATPYTGPFTNTTSALVRAIAYNAAHTSWAEAAPVFVEIWPTYALAWSTPGGGTISRSPAPYTAPNRWLSNTVVTLTAIASNGWTFLRWTGDATATTNALAVLLDRPQTMSAIFGTPLTLFTNGSGQVWVDPPDALHAYGTAGLVSAIPSPGQFLAGWAGAATGFANPLTLRFTNANPQVTALFGALRGEAVGTLVSGNDT